MLNISGFIDEIDADFQEQTAAAVRMGLKYVEVRSASSLFVCDYPDEDIRGFKRRLNELGLKTSCLASPIGKIRVTDPFDAEWERFKRFIEFAGFFEAPYMRIFSFYVPEHADLNGFADEVITRTGKMAEYAADAGITLLHENEKGIFGDTTERCLYIAKTINNPYLRLIFDFANFVQCGQDTWEAYEVLKPYIAYFHIKDELKATGESVPAGMGDGKISIILKDALENGYSGFISLEPHLVDFDGLKNLENAPRKRNSSMSGEEAFIAAYEAMESILNDCLCAPLRAMSLS